MVDFESFGVDLRWQVLQEIYVLLLMRSRDFGILHGPFDDFLRFIKEVRVGQV